jgi:hypothetical protein
LSSGKSALAAIEAAHERGFGIRAHPTAVQPENYRLTQRECWQHFVGASKIAYF